MNPHKILIVGGGIAGSTLALHLIDLGAKVTLIDKGENHSTSIAAGMVNPIVFRRMNLSWEVQKNFPLAVDFFKNLEIKINQKLIFPIKIRRLFSSKEERELWSERAQTNDFKDFLNPITKDDINYDSNLNKFGTGRVNAFWVDSKKYYEHSHKLINTNAQLLYHIFDSDNLNLTDVSYNSEIYDSIVFCLGYENNRIELFKEIPIQTTKGQLLTIASEKIKQKVFFNS